MHAGEFIYTVKAKFVIKPKSVENHHPSKLLIGQNFVKNNKILMFVEAMNLY